MTSRPVVWKLIAVRICCRPLTIRLPPKDTRARGARAHNGRGPAGRPARRCRAGAAAAAPAVAVVAVQVGPDRTRVGGWLAVLAPVVIDAAGDIVGRAVRVHPEDDPDLA